MTPAASTGTWVVKVGDAYVERRLVGAFSVKYGETDTQLSAWRTNHRDIADVIAHVRGGRIVRLVRRPRAWIVKNGDRYLVTTRLVGIRMWGQKQHRAIRFAAIDAACMFVDQHRALHSGEPRIVRLKPAHRAKKGGRK